MSYLIAVSGKGGVGKTTIAGLLVARLKARQCGPVLAVDADPNMCLDSALGVKVENTIGRVREDARIIASKGMEAGISKQELLELKIAESLVESEDFDLIAMGRSEGAGCYCYANNVLKNAIQQIASSYPVVVLDNEAGLENLSRRIVQDVDLMIMVADPSSRGLETLKRLHEMTSEMEIKYRKLLIVVNRMRKEELPEKINDIKNATKADFIIGLRECDELAEMAEKGESLMDAPKSNPAVEKIDNFLQRLGLPGKNPQT